MILWPFLQMDPMCKVIEFFMVEVFEAEIFGLANVCINRDIQMSLSSMVPFHCTGKWALVALVAILDKAMNASCPSV